MWCGHTHTHRHSSQSARGDADTQGHKRHVDTFAYSGSSDRPTISRCLQIRRYLQHADKGGDTCAPTRPLLLHSQRGARIRSVWVILVHVRQRHRNPVCVWADALSSLPVRADICLFLSFSSSFLLLLCSKQQRRHSSFWLSLPDTF